MKKIVIALFLFTLLLPVMSYSAEISDTPANRELLARKYLSIVPTAQIVDDMIQGMMEAIPVEQRAEFSALLKKAINIEEMDKFNLKALVKVFSTSELSAMNDFYQSAVGRSIMSKMKLYTAELMPYYQSVILRSIQNAKPESKK